MRHINLRLKAILVVLSILLAISFFVGCDNEVGVTNLARTKFIGARVSDNSSKGLSVSYNAMALDSYYWYYIAEKTDSGMDKGAASEYTPWNPDNSGNAQVGLTTRLNEFSIGDWRFSFRACTSGTYEKENVVFEGSLNFKVDIDVDDNRMYVPVQYVDVVYDEDGVSNPVTLQGNISVAADRITTNNNDLNAYGLNTANLRKFVTITDLSGNTIVSYTDEELKASPLATTVTDVDAGVYSIIILYEYFDDAVFTNRVASYICHDTLSVHGNLTTTLEGEFTFVKLEDWEITFEDGSIVYPNGRATADATTNGGYTGLNRITLAGEYGSYKFGAGIQFPTDTSPSDTAEVDYVAHRSLKNGYFFRGWGLNSSTSETTITGLDSTSIGPKTVYAYWEPVKSTLTVKGNKGAGSTAVHADYTNDAYYEDYLPNLGAKPTRAGYAFGGYYLDENCNAGEQVYTSASTLDYNATVASLKIKGKTTFTDANKYYNLTTNTSLYAKWTPETYTITFSTTKNAGVSSKMSGTITAPADKTVTFDAETPHSNLTENDYGRVDGWKFEGWGVANNNSTSTDTLIYDRNGRVSGTEYISSTNYAWVNDLTNGAEGASTLTLYGKFTQKKTVITLNKGNAAEYDPHVEGQADGSMVICYDDTSSTSYNAVTVNNTLYPNWNVEGYYTEPNGKGAKVLNADGTLVVDTTTTNLGFVNNTTDGKWAKYHQGDDINDLEITLYARFLNGQYTLTFDGNDSKGSTSATSTASKTVNYNNGAVSVITPPTRNGYIFGGFYLSSDCKDGEQVFTSAGAVVNGVNSLEYGVNAKSYATSITNATGVWVNASNRTLYAKWTPEKTTVTFNNNYTIYNSDKGMSKDNDFSATPGNATFTFDEKLTDMPVMTKPGWKFEGWGSANTVTTATTEMLTDSKEYLAGVTLGSVNATNAAKDWIWDDAGTTGADHTMTLYAKWTQKKTEITLDKGVYGLADGSATILYDKNTREAFTAVTSNTTTNPGHWTLEGYYTSLTGGLKVLNADGTFNAVTETVSAGYFDNTTNRRWMKYHSGNEQSEKITLYAHWVNGQYTITFNPMDSSKGLGSTAIQNAPTPNPKPVSVSQAVGNVANNTYRKGYIFGGWYLNRMTSATSTELLFNYQGTLQTTVRNSEREFESDKLIVDGSGNWVAKNSLIVYAKWTPEKTTITYDGNNSAYGTMTANPTVPSNGTYVFDTTLTNLPKAAVTGWWFAGWGTESGASTDTNAMLTDVAIDYKQLNNYIDSNKHWIYDSNDSSGADNTLTVYAKFAPAKTKIRLEADSRYASSSGVAYVSYDNTALDSSGKTLATAKTGYTIEGYYTVPQYMEDEYASSTCYKVLNADGSFATTSTNAKADKSGTFGVNYGGYDHGFRQFFDDSSSNKWRIYHTDDPSITEEITLYAHFVKSSADEWDIKFPTNIDIDWGMGRFGYPQGGMPSVTIGYAGTKIEGDFDDVFNYSGQTFVGLFTTLTDICSYSTTNTNYPAKVIVSNDTLYSRCVILQNGTVNNMADVTISGIPYVTDGKWVFNPADPTHSPKLKFNGCLQLYAVWR